MLDPFTADGQFESADEVWNVNLSETDSRTMNTTELVQAYAAGTITSEAYVWKDGMADWVPILECGELLPLLPMASGPQAAPPPAASAVASSYTDNVPKIGGVPLLGATAPAPARAQTAKNEPSPDLFGEVHVAGAEEEDLATSARLPSAPLPGSTAYDDKPTGARNENSVLFSLDSLRAGFSGAPAAKAPSKPGSRPPQQSNPDDPFGMGGGSGIAAMGGNNPLFTLSANQALLSAPPPPEPPVVKAVDYGAPARASAPNDKKKLAVLIGGGVGAVAVLGLLGALLFGGKEDSAKAEAEDQKTASAETKADEAKKDEPKKDEAADSKKEEPAPAAEAKAEEAKPAEPAAETKPQEAKATEPAKAIAATAPKTSTKKEEPAAAAPAGAAPFSKASAISALTAASGRAAGCKRAGGPKGSGKVQVTFAPSGKVTSASVMGAPFAGTSVGSCVASAFRGAKVPAFSGNAVTVSKSFTIN